MSRIGVGCVAHTAPSSGDVFLSVNITQPDQANNRVTLLRVPASDFWSLNDQAGEKLGFVVERLEALVATEPGASWHLIVPARGEDGFEIELSGSEGRVCGWFGGLYQEFDGIRDAVFWCERALCAGYRLRVTYVGKQPREWVLEPLEPREDGSVPALSMGYLSPFKWLYSTSVDYLQNQHALH